MGLGWVARPTNTKIVNSAKVLRFGWGVVRVVEYRCFWW